MNKIKFFLLISLTFLIVYGRGANDAPSNAVLLTITGTGSSDDIWIGFRADGSISKNGNDDYKLFGGGGPELNTRTLDAYEEILATYFLPLSMKDNATVPVDITIYTAGNNTITASNLSSFNPSVTVTLIDLKNLTSTVLNTTNHYTFYSATCSQDRRFLLHFGPVISNTGPYCPDNTINLKYSVDGMHSYSWSGPNGFTSTSQNPVINNATPTMSGNYTVTYSSPYDISVTSTASINVTVNSSPTISASNGSVCIGSSTTISASGGNTYNWSDGLGTGVTKTVNPTVRTTYTVTGTDLNGCSNTATSIVTVNQLPDVIAAGGSVCPGFLFNNLSASGAISYDWNTGGTGTPITVNPEITTTYTVTGTDGNNCSNTASAVVNVNSLPSINAGLDQSVRLGNSVVLTATGGNSYLWSTTETTNQITVSPVTTQTYSVTGTGANSCTNTDEVIVTLLPAATITSAQTGNWGTGSTWVAGLVPGINDDVQIAAGHSVTAVANATCKSLNVIGSVVVASGKTLTVNGPVTTIATSPSAIGQIVMKDNSATLNANDRVEVQLYLVDNNYHLLSSPMKNALADVLWGYSVARFYEPINSYSNLIKGKYLIPSVGYSVKKGTNPLYPPSSLLTFSAPNSSGLNNGNISIGLTKTIGKGEGWNLVGNPYPSAINLDLMDTEVTQGWNNTNISPWVYTWNITTSKYEMYNMSDRSKTTYGSKYIPPMQGVWVYCTSNQGTWSMNNKVRVANNQPYWKKGLESDNSINPNILIKIYGANNLFDEASMSFTPTASIDFNTNVDASKLLSSKVDLPQVFFKFWNIEANDSFLTAFKYLPDSLLSNYSVPVYFKVGVSGTYNFIATNLESFSSDVDITLVDLNENKEINLKQVGNYSFTSPAVSNDKRFEIRFGKITSTKKIDQSEFNIYSSRNSIIIQNTSKSIEKNIVNVYDILGNLIISKELNNFNFNYIDLNQSTASAIYLVKVISPKGTFFRKINLSLY